MSDTTFEEAKRCSRCQQPGKVVTSKPVPGGGRTHVIECDNERCVDYTGRRLVQTNPDGTIPQGRSGPKAFPKLNEKSGVAQAARDELALLNFMSTHPGLTRREAIRAMGGYDGRQP